MQLQLLEIKHEGEKLRAHGAALTSPRITFLSTDTNRFPVVIAEADCLTFACVDTDGHESPDLISFPIQQEVMVLRREQKGCSFSYRLEGEVVTLGCTCVRPTISYY
ncbi:interleukin-17F-like [Phyllobates terribilis]|uniref:interleukin-17F-like n=1 Tax=Phyllobates terribilis TaxID=111132 RepID=UPI003CCA78E0